MRRPAQLRDGMIRGARSGMPWLRPKSYFSAAEVERPASRGARFRRENVYCEWTTPALHYRAGRAMKKPVPLTSHLAPHLRAIPFLKTPADSEMVVLTDRQREDLARIGLRLRLP